MSNFADLKKTIRKIILENASHRCLDGRLVDKDSIECYDDVCNRIEDVAYERDLNNRGTANRTYYNGILADLRKRRRRLEKIHGINKI